MQENQITKIKMRSIIVMAKSSRIDMHKKIRPGRDNVGNMHTKPEDAAPRRANHVITEYAICWAGS